MLCLHFLCGVIVWLAVLGKILTAGPKEATYHCGKLVLHVQEE